MALKIPIRVVKIYKGETFRKNCRSYGIYSLPIVCYLLYICAMFRENISMGSELLREHDLHTEIYKEE